MTQEQLDGAHEKAASRPADSQDVELYVRTYQTLLRSSGDIRLKTLVPTHLNIDSSLHPDARSDSPDMSALIYSILRLPPQIIQVRRILLGDSPEIFRRAGYPDVETWEPASASARRRWWYFDGKETLAVYLGSSSDLDDLIPVLTALQIEWNKLHRLLNDDPSTIEILQTGIDNLTPLYGELTRLVRERIRLSPDDWDRLRVAWGGRFWENLRAIAAVEKSFTVRMLGGTHIGYAKSTRRWWQPIADYLVERGLESRPTYIVSSNPHGFVNLLSGSIGRRKAEIETLLDRSADPELRFEYDLYRRGALRGSPENFLYYAARKLIWDRDPVAVTDRIAEEHERGLASIESRAGLRVDAQVIELDKLRPVDFDQRVCVAGHEAIMRSDAIVLNIDYPLGLAAYRILRQMAESLDSILGIYIIGKAATLNGSIGDVMLADLVFDEHSQNHYWLDNAFQAQDIAPFLQFGSVLDHQKAVTVKGTFLQNRDYLEFYYREHFTVVEMEAGPYLDALYEMLYPGRYPVAEHINLAKLPYDLGIVHYASDTPYTRGKNLGANKLSYFGMDSAYATSVATLRRIFDREVARLRLPVAGTNGSAPIALAAESR